MYGLVNRAIKDLVFDVADAETWAVICHRAGLDGLDFDDTVVYDDTVTYDLVAAASETLGQSPEAILEGFGRHWILFTGREGWGPLLDMSGSDLRSMVAGLDALHARVTASMPQCRMPRFSVVDRPDGSIEIQYRSDRAGLAPMVRGLLAGLAEHFGESWTIDHRGATDDADLFVLEPATVVSASAPGTGGH